MSDFKAKMHQIQFRLGPGEAYSAPQTPWLHLRGPTSKGGKGERGRERKGREREREGERRREGKGPPRVG